MSKIMFLIGFVCVLQLASCRVIREAPADSTITLTDITEKAETAYNTLHENVLKFANVSSDAELSSLLRTQSESYAEKLKALASQVTEEVKANSDKFDDFFKTLATTFTATANELKEKNPELASFQDKFEKSLKSVLQESEKLKEKLKEDGAEISANAEKILKTVYTDTLNTAKTVTDQIANAAAEAKKN